MWDKSYVYEVDYKTNLLFCVGLGRGLLLVIGGDSKLRYEFDAVGVRREMCIARLQVRAYWRTSTEYPNARPL